MVYQGSKAKLRKYILPILQNCINENHIENYYEPFCLDSSTIVFTKNGIKTIEELQVGDYILNEHGNFIEVINKVKSNEHNGKYIKIKGNADVIATDNHKFYVNSTELSVCELKENMSLDTGLQSINENPIIDLSKYITVTKNYKKGRNGKIINENKIKLSHVSPITNRYVPITKELMRCYGLVVAEGDKSNLTMNENELNYLEEFIKNYLNILGIQDNCKKYYHRNHAIQLAIPYKTIYEKLFFNAMNVGYGARNKNISFLFSVTNDMALEALRYMIIGDGCVRQKGNYRSICYKTTSKTLAYQLQCLLSIKFGIKSTITYGVSKVREIEGRKISSTDYYDISIHREDDIKFILMESNNNIQIHENTKKYKITNIEKIQNRTFYDITVNSKSHKFLIQGGIITHNCGGANMIDHIQCKNRIGSDINLELIELLKYMRDNPNLDIFPQDCSFEHYSDVRENRRNKTNKYSIPYTSGIGYFASFGGRYFDGGYGKDPSGKRNIYHERLEYAKEQAPLLKGIEFGIHSFEDYDPNYFNQCLFYLDPPYRDTKIYNGKDGFPYDLFYDWCKKLGNNNYVFISEYYMPSDFKCIWSKERKVMQKSDREKGEIAVEKLFTIGLSSNDKNQDIFDL